MATHNVEVLITAQPEQVFPFLVEPERLKQWMNGLKESKPLTEGGVRVGARSEEIVEEEGRRMVVLTEITHLEFNRTLVVKLENEIFDAVSTYELLAAIGGTNVKHSLETSYKGMMKLMAGMIGGMVQKKLEGDLHRLKAVAERT
jgi:uncharacterized protein YndB with AHSA1/START domain